MRINWKLLTGFSLFGAVLSLVSGIAGGNPFGTVLLRLLLSAVVFGALGFGIQAVLRRYLPDLLQTSRRAPKSGGGAVDILIDDELPASAAGGRVEGREASEEPPADERGIAEAEEVEEVLGSEEEFQAMELGEFETEPFESAAADTGSYGSGSSGSGRWRGSTAATQPISGGESDVSDVLPEIDSLEDDLPSEIAAEPESSVPGEADKPVKRTPMTPREMRRAQIEETVKDQDPENLARAVRTFLKKDQ